MGMLDGFPCSRTREFIKFSIYFTKAGTLPSCAAFAASNLESVDSTVVLLLNFGGILQQKLSLTERAKNMVSGFSSGIHQNIQKARKLMNTLACQEIIVFPNGNCAEI